MNGSGRPTGCQPAQPSITVERMSTILEIERAVSELSTDDLSRFRAWFLEFDARLWDDRIEADVAAGRLRDLAEEARADLRAGRTRAL
jgi:hypothetical protein